jgi:hypothetical protein
MRSITMMVAVITVMASLSAPAFAYRGEATNLSTLRHESTSRANQIVRIEGDLSCNMGAENSGAGCSLQLQEAKTGRIYSLTEAANAMRLFQDGTKKVAITGTLSDSETLQVNDAETL